MIVDGITCDVTAEGWRLSTTVHSPAAIGGERLYCAMQGADSCWLPEIGDAFLAALLMPVMSLGEELVIEAPGSRHLLRSTRTIMNIYPAWWDHLLLVCIQQEQARRGTAYERLLGRLRRAAKGVGRKLLVVDTNVRSLMTEAAYWPVVS